LSNEEKTQDYENFEKGRIYIKTNYIILDGSARTVTLGFLQMDYLQ
jgi:hypothetical protein